VRYSGIHNSLAEADLHQVHLSFEYRTSFKEGTVGPMLYQRCLKAAGERSGTFSFGTPGSLTLLTANTPSFTIYFAFSMLLRLGLSFAGSKVCRWMAAVRGLQCKYSTCGV
jgi:hypothetical protein